jgi:hypothetical protein
VNGTSIGNWLILSALFWISGYVQFWIVEPGPYSKLVYVPKWMYFLLIAPQHKLIPKFVMLTRSVYLQLLGITMILYRIILGQNLLKEPLSRDLIGFFGSMILSFIVTQWLSKKHPYQWQNCL